MPNAKIMSLAIEMARHQIREIPKTTVKRMLGILNVAPYQNMLSRTRPTRQPNFFAWRLSHRAAGRTKTKKHVEPTVGPTPLPASWEHAQSPGG